MIELGVFSLWTGTTKFKLTRESAMLFSAAVAFGKAALPDMELVTDKRGSMIANRLGWDFPSVAIALEDFCPRHARHVWMLGKIEAQQIQVRPFVHIDLDLILFHPLPIRIACAQVAAQGKDDVDHYFSQVCRSIAAKAGINPASTPFNTALIGWNDLRLMREYCSRSMACALRVADRFENGGSVSIVCEQLTLGEIARANRVKVEEAILAPGNLQEWEAADVSFCHLWGDTKRDRVILHGVERRFSEDHPEAYSRFLKGFDKIK